MGYEGFWRQWQDVKSRGFLAGFGAVNQVHYLFPQGGGPSSAQTSFANIRTRLRSRDIVLFGGVLREEAVAPVDIHDVLIYGCANRPRQATDSGVPTGGGASWLPPTTPTAATPLIALTKNIGWQFENIQFNPTAAVTSPAILLARSASTEAGQTKIKNCLFLGGGANQVGVEDQGGNGFVVIEDSEFILVACAIKLRAIVTGIPGWWRIERNFFSHNTNDILMSLHASLIKDNVFQTAGAGAVNKVISTKSQGDGGAGNSENIVIMNHFNNLQANIQNSNGYDGCATDVWRNYSNDTPAMTVGVPGA